MRPLTTGTNRKHCTPLPTAPTHTRAHTHTHTGFRPKFTNTFTSPDQELADSLLTSTTSDNKGHTILTQLTETKFINGPCSSHSLHYLLVIRQSHNFYLFHLLTTPDINVDPFPFSFSHTMHQIPRSEYTNITTPHLVLIWTASNLTRPSWQCHTQIPPPIHTLKATHSTCSSIPSALK